MKKFIFKLVVIYIFFSVAVNAAETGDAAISAVTTGTIHQSNNPIIQQSVSTNTGKVFYFEPGHFKFTMPDYWEKIPDKELEVYKNLLKKTYPNRTENYVLAFQRKDIDYFKMPYALVDIRQGKMPTIQEIEFEARNFAKKLRRSYSDLYRSNLFGEIEAMEGVYDPEKEVIIEYYRMFRAKDKKYICSMTAVFPCRYGFVNFHFFYKAENESKYIGVIEGIIDSVTFDKGYEYIKTKSHPEESYKTVIYIIVVVLGIIWVAMRFYGRKK